MKKGGAGVGAYHWSICVQNKAVTAVGYSKHGYPWLKLDEVNNLPEVKVK